MREVPRRVASSVAALAFCLEPHDLVLSKLAAHRERDWAFARDALDAGPVRTDTLLARVDDLPVGEDVRNGIARWLQHRARD